MTRLRYGVALGIRERHFVKTDAASERRREVVSLSQTQGVSTTRIKRKIIDNIYSVIAADLRREVERPDQWKAEQLEKAQATSD